jgi:predicted transcriptional regulator
VQASLNPPKRSDVLLALWNRAVWLDQAINAVDSNKKNVTPKLKQLVYMAQVYNQLCRTVLYALKDEELELRVLELEIIGH